MNAGELIAEALKLRDEGGYADVAIAVTTGHKTHLLWLSKGEMKRELKQLLRRGVAEAFVTIRLNGSTRFVANATPLPGVDEKRADHILWAFGSKFDRWQMRLH